MPASRTAPASRPAPIPRERLAQRLDRTGSSACIIVVAPAGYGKTTLLRGWTSTLDQGLAWVSLNARHDDAALLVLSIIHALGESSDPEQLAMAPLVSPEPDFANVVIPRLCAALAVRAPATIVLDDLHVLSSKAALEAIRALAQHLPEGVRLVLASREQPAIGLGRLRTSGEVLELGTEEMAMTLPEAKRMLLQLDQEIDPGRVEELHAHTEGWAVGLYLAALRVGRAGGAVAAITDFTGEDRFFADYVREEFLAGTPSASRDFLIRASILDRLSGELCDAVLDRQGSAADLAVLSRTNMLLVPLDNHDREYRFHALLRETLQGELRGLGAEAQRGLHLRAAEWYDEHDDPEHAVEHAIASGDVGLAAELIGGRAAVYGAGGRVTTMRRWLGAFNREQIAASPELSIAAGVVDLTDGNGVGVRHWAAATRASSARLGVADTRRAQLLDIRAVILQASAPAGNLERVSADLAGVYGEVSEDDPWLALAVLAEALSRLALGETSQARHLFEQGEQVASATGPSMQAICLAHLAILDVQEHDPGPARDASEKALRVISHHALEGYRTSAIVFAAAALVLAESGSSRLAAEMLSRARAAASPASINPVYDTLTEWSIARTLILLDEIPEARERLHLAGRHAARIPEAELLGRWLQDAWLAADAAAAERERWPLTPAELRLLHLMTTHLSFPRIADELFVSANTVKTQAQSIYRKFSVSSRAEAIAVARTAGLLGDGPPPELRGTAKSPEPGDVGSRLRA